MNNIVAKMYVLDKIANPSYISLVKTNDPDYLPASSSQVDELRELILNFKNDFRESTLVSSTPKLLVNGTKQSVSHFLPTSINLKPLDNPVKKKFEFLATKWKDETQRAPTILEIATHPAYQQIIGMGSSAIPFILKQLKTEPDHWFWALKAITCEDPVPEKSRGNLNAMTDEWLEWGKSKGYEC